MFSLETKSKLKSVEVDGKVVLTKCLNSNKLGIVTTKSAYYLDLSNETEGAVKLIDRYFKFSRTYLIHMNGV